MLLLYLAKWNAFLAITQQHQKGQNSTKSRSLLVHIVELSTAVVKVDIKVINASLTQNQCLQCVTPRFNACWDTATNRTTLLNWNWTMTSWSSWTMSTTKQNQIYQCFRKRFSQRWLQFLFAYPFGSWLAVSCFSFWKALLNVHLCL